MEHQIVFTKKDEHTVGHYQKWKMVSCDYDDKDIFL